MARELQYVRRVIGGNDRLAGRQAQCGRPDRIAAGYDARGRRRCCISRWRE